MSTMFYEGYWFKSSLGGAVVYVLIALFTVIGNVLVCVAFWKDPYGQLRRPQTFFLANLALSDIIMGIFAETLLAANYWLNDIDDLYFAHYVFAILSGASSLLNLTALSFIRYCAVKDPFAYQSNITQTRVLVGILLVWLQSLHLALLPVFGWKTAPYQLYLYGVGFGIPFVVIIYSYIGFYRAIRGHTSRIKAMEARSSLREPANDSDSGSLKKSTSMTTVLRMKNVIEREKRVTKTIVLIMSVFMAFWFPFLVIDIVMVQCSACRSSASLHLARDITLTITYFSSGINPLLYTWRVRQFRLAVKKIVGLADVEFVIPCRVRERRGTANAAIKDSPF